MNEIQKMQGQAIRDYERYYADDLVCEAPARYGALQAAMLAEIALQLARIATQLEDGKISMLEGEDIVERLSRIGSIIMDK